METFTYERGAGVLLHISSLPNEYGIGSLGKEAYAFADFLALSKIKYWQILPLVQTGYGDSPYQSVCCTSGNPYFIDLEALARAGLLTEEELNGQKTPLGKVDYGALYQNRYAALRRAYSRFDCADPRFAAFEKSGAFEDYALFMAIKTKTGKNFADFPDDLKFRREYALTKFKNENPEEYRFWLFLQYEFREQWKKLKEYVNGKGIKIIGDIPLYVAYDSSDVWARPELFTLDENYALTDVAGVPPDYFSATGQLWGNPLYRWDRLEEEGYGWWIARVEAASRLYDVIRIDHFRGLDRYFDIAAGASTAECGEWKDGPKKALFDEIERRLGKLEIIAEDLGILDDGVVALRDGCGFPGMKILLFAFDGDENNAYLPANTQENSVTYTGTHDNDTVLGYLETLTDAQFKVFAKSLRKALRSEGAIAAVYDRKSAARAMTVCALANRSRLAVVPMQDILLFGNEHRMNTPSTKQGNWQFRLGEIPDRRQAALLRKTVQDYKR